MFTVLITEKGGSQKRLTFTEPEVTIGRVPGNDVVLPKGNGKADVSSLEMETRLVAEADNDQRNFHFRVGAPRLARTVRVARDLLVDVDDKNRISGVWLLNVPPCPTDL